MILVTGASSGIGRELAVQYSKRDCKLMLVGRNETELENTQTTCKYLGCKDVEFVKCDV